MKSFKSVNDYIDGNDQWQNELNILRTIISSTELIEGVKWGAPIYTINNKNVVGMAAFKNYVGLWFHQGVFLKDKNKVLLNAQEGVTKALRQWRFTSMEELNQNRQSILEYLLEAIQNQKDGKEMKPQKNELIIPAELKNALNNDNKLNEAFNRFSHSLKREFAEHIGSAKREETRLSRLDKSIPMILDGVGLNDKYRK